jgi:subtilisin family serine protease
MALEKMLRPLQFTFCVAAFALGIPSGMADPVEVGADDAFANDDDQEPIRSWRNREETRKTEARLEAFDEGTGTVTLSKGGRTLRVRLDRLSIADEAYIRGWFNSPREVDESVAKPNSQVRMIALPGAAPVPPAITGMTEEQLAQAMVAGLKGEHEAIVGYAPGRLARAIALCEKLGLICKETYGIGEFLICSWPAGTDLKAATDALLADPSIRYLEPNWTIKTDPMEKPRGLDGRPTSPVVVPRAGGEVLPAPATAGPRPADEAMNGEKLPPHSGGSLYSAQVIRNAGLLHQAGYGSGVLYPSQTPATVVGVRPNDTYFDFLWGMKNIKAPQAWGCRRSSNIVVAVVDTGADWEHEDLKANIWHNPWEIAGDNLDNDGNGVVDDVFGYNAILGNGNPYDDFGHGTHCSGTIGAIGNNKLGVVGVNWRVQIMVVKFMQPNGQGSASGTTEGSIKAIDYAWRNGARIISASWANRNPRQLNQALYEAVRRAEAAGVVFVAAAGNDGVNNDAQPSFPASFANTDDPSGQLSNVISVAAVTEQNQLAGFSNFGAKSVLIAAPGQDILSTLPTWAGKYGYQSGTSMATPHVAGAIALTWSDPKYAGFSAVQVKGLVLSRSQRRPQLYGKVATGGTLDLRFLCPVHPCPPVCCSIPTCNDSCSLFGN